MNQGQTRKLTAPAFDARALIRRLLEIAQRDTNVVVIFVVINNLLRAVSSVILTRLLVPEVFGIAGVIGSISFTVAMASDLGFQAFVVRHADGDNRRFLDTVWTISLLRSAFLTVLLMALAEPIALLFDKPELAPIIFVSSLTFIIEGVASLSLLTALRNRQILRLSLLEAAVVVIQIVFAATLAYFWRNYWAILVAMLISSAFKALLSYTMFPDSARRFAWEPRFAKDLWKFARFVTGSSLISLVLAQSDKLLLARLMPLDDFGLYILAGNLASAPLAFTGAYASRVLYPTYSQLFREGADNLRAQFYAKRWMPSLLFTFAAGGLIGSAPLVITILYDPRYANAAIYLQILAISPMLALASNAANEALTATGRIRATFEASVAKLIWLVIAAPIGFYYGGPIGLVLAVAMMEVAALALKWWQMHRASLLDIRQELIFLAAGGAGILIGTIGDQIIRGFFI